MLQIMTGTDHHIAGLGNLIEWTNISGQNTPKGVKQNTAPQRGMPGYEGYLNERVATLPEILRDAGYLTLMSGKWHLGLTHERSPRARGFERSLAHLPACSNHYAYEPQLVDRDVTPSFMEQSFIALHIEDDKYVKKLPEGWYSSDGYGDRMKQYIQEWHERKDNRPFFAYLPFTAPHWPLQAPQEYIRKYRGVYDEGPDALRMKRLERLKELGMIAPDVTPHPVVADEVKEWADLTADEKAKSCRAMECFAGMVECIDVNVGKVVSYLEEIGELDNTFVCFMSDNGAEGAAYEAYPIVQGHMMQHLQKYYNNSLENLGNFDSWIW
jgi:arylsulfatase A-like enzyme